MTKKKPNTETISTLLDREFKYRRDWIKALTTTDRIGTILQEYPCFSNYNHVSRW